MTLNHCDLITRYLPFSYSIRKHRTVNFNGVRHQLVTTKETVNVFPCFVLQTFIELIEETKDLDTTTLEVGVKNCLSCMSNVMREKELKSWSGKTRSSWFEKLNIEVLENRASVSFITSSWRSIFSDARYRPNRGMPPTDP